MINRNTDLRETTFSKELNYFDVRNVVNTYEKDPKSIVTSNAFQSIDFNKLVMNNRVYDKIDHIFSNQIDNGDVTEVINQESAGLCWMCPGLTMCRRFIVKKLNFCKEFHLSLNYLLFWDKLEKSNYFMNYIVENRHKKLESFAINNML